MLRACDLHASRDYAHVRPNTHALFEGPLTQVELADVIWQLPSAFAADEQRACYVFGFGSQTRSAYRLISEIDGVQIHWQGKFGPGCLMPLLWLAASHGGLIEVSNPRSLPRLVETLAHLAMLEVYSVSKVLSPQLLAHVKTKQWTSSPFEVVALDPAYICIGVDGDSQDSESGIFGWFSYGKLCQEHRIAPIFSSICK